MPQTPIRPSLDARIERLFGAAIDWRRATGVVHVTALEARTRAVLAIGPGAPASATDRFVLGFARARADAIVTTGAILRAEPHLIHRCADEPDAERSWQAWRRALLGRREAPILVVLSGSGRIPPDHPALAGPGRRILWTRANDPLRPIGRARGLEVRVDAAADAAPAGPVGDAAAASLARAIAWLRAEVGAETIALEAGPSATLGLYRGGDGAPAAAPIDELLLALFAGDGAPRVAGESFPSAARLAAYFAGGGKSSTTPASTDTPETSSASVAAVASDQPRSRVRIEERSGSWTFERYRRGGQG